MEKPLLACHVIKMWLGQILLLMLLFVSSPACAKNDGRSHLKHLWQKNILLISSKRDGKIISLLMESNTLINVDNYDGTKLIDNKEFCLENGTTQGLIEKLTAINIVYLIPNNSSDLKSMLYYVKR